MLLATCSSWFLQSRPRTGRDLQSTKHSISYVGVLTVGVITVSKTGLARGHNPLVAFESSLIEVAELHLEEIVLESIQCENQFYALPDGG